MSFIIRQRTTLLKTFLVGVAEGAAYTTFGIYIGMKYERDSHAANHHCFRQEKDRGSISIINGD